LPTKYVLSSPPRTDFNADSAHWNRTEIKAGYKELGIIDAYFIGRFAVLVPVA